MDKLSRLIGCSDMESSPQQILAAVRFYASLLSLLIEAIWIGELKREDDERFLKQLKGMVRVMFQDDADDAQFMSQLETIAKVMFQGA